MVIFEMRVTLFLIWQILYKMFKSMGYFPPKILEMIILKATGCLVVILWRKTDLRLHSYPTPLVEPRNYTQGPDSFMKLVRLDDLVEEEVGLNSDRLGLCTPVPLMLPTDLRT